jgi:hypothetical protein
MRNAPSAARARCRDEWAQKRRRSTAIRNHGFSGGIEDFAASHAKGHRLRLVPRRMRPTPSPIERKLEPKTYQQET